MATSPAVSEVNSEEMARMVEDMDNLDKELFNDTFKKSSSIGKNSRTDGESKKRVVFKDYNEDDPLAGVISDEENSPRERKNIVSASAKSSLMEDLFKIRSSDTSLTVKSDDKVNLIPISKVEDNAVKVPQAKKDVPPRSEISVVSQSEPEKNVQRSRNVSNDEDDILASLIDKPRVTDEKSKKSSLIEDLFQSRPRATPTESNLPKDTPKPEVPRRSLLDLGNATEPTRTQPQAYAPRPSTTREPRRGRRNSKIINDPLGLLQTDLLSDQPLKPTVDEGMHVRQSGAQSAKVQDDLPEWLGGTKKSEGVKETLLPNSESSKPEKLSIPKENTEPRDTSSLTESTMAQQSNLEAVHSYPEHYSLLLGTQFDQQAAVISMQQQEHELKTATVLSQQNEQLNKVLDIQRSRLSDQEKQFNALIKIQVERQGLLEKQLKAQQERIDQYIRALMAQPISVPASTFSATTEMEGKKRETSEEAEEEDIFTQKTQLDKSKLESILHALNERQENEIMMQEETYKRQISFLQETMDKLEKRARQELEILEADYVAKLEKLKEEKMQTESQYKEEIDNLKREHARYIDEIYERHSQNIRLIQKEHFETIENISKAKQVENSVIEAMTNRKTDIENMLDKANLIIESIKDGQEKIHEETDKTTKLRENYLKAQEDELVSQKIELEKRNSILERHNAKLMETTEQLDSRVTELVAELQRQSRNYNEAQETLEKKSRDLLKERELFEEKVKWEREHLKTLKESWLKEQERQLKSLAEEKEAVVAERAQLEVLSKLKIGTEDVAKVELQAAIQAAQDATASANREKLKWQEKNNQLEVQRQFLEDRQNQLVLKARQLENLALSIIAKRDEGVRALSEAKLLESRHKEKVKQLHEQLEALSQREKRVAVERFNVARDRIMSRTSEVEKPERDTKANVQPNFSEELSLFSDIRPTTEVTDQFVDVVDPNLVMLRLSLDEQLSNTNEYLQFIDN